MLAGEGRNELGSFAIEAAFRGAPEPGLIEALLRQVRRGGWQIEDALLWRKLPKLRVGIGGHGEALNVLRAHHHARRRGVDVLAFTRDRDGVKFEHRDDEIERAIAEIAASGERPLVIGGVAIEKLESWLAAIAGHTGSEDMRRPEEKLAALGVGDKDTRAMVALVEQKGLSGVPSDARSLHRWIERATTTFNTFA